MKTVLLFLLSILCIGVYADGTNVTSTVDGGAGQSATGQVIATTLLSDGSINTWTQADLLAALQLINRKYHRDCETGSGRAAWHGRLKRETVATNETGQLVKTEYHDDGQTFTFTSRVVTAAAAVSNANSRLKTTMSKGVPVALAEARRRREEEKNTVSNVTIAVEANVR